MCGKLILLLRNTFGIILKGVRGAHCVEQSTLGTFYTDTEQSGITLCTYKEHA